MSKEVYIEVWQQVLDDLSERIGVSDEIRNEVWDQLYVADQVLYNVIDQVANQIEQEWSNWVRVCEKKSV